MGNKPKVVVVGAGFGGIAAVKKLAKQDIDIVITGLRKGERLDEPLWLEEEDPTPTEYPKIFQLRHCPLEYRLQELLEAIKPVCFFDSSKSDMYRNKKMLVDLLCSAVPSLKEFYDEQK